MPLYRTPPVKATGAELDALTDDAKFLTAKAVQDGTKVPHVAPGTSGNIIQSDGTDWGSVAQDGWLVLGACTYETADAPTFTFSIASDATGLLSVGMKIKLTQTTIKYFIITSVGAFSAGKTIITVYGGTDYTLANAAITLPNYSLTASPFGFPKDPTKWTVVVSSTSDFTQVPTGTTIYNAGTFSISIPIGLWLVKYKVLAQIGNAALAANDKYLTVSLSTANNTVIAGNSLGVAASDVKLIRSYVEKTLPTLSLASKASYYLNYRNDGGGGAGASIYILGTQSTTFITAVCAYL